MCDVCEELKKKFQEAETITARQSLWNIYDKQRNKCTKEQGMPVPLPKPEIKKEKKAKKSKLAEKEPNTSMAGEIGCEHIHEEPVGEKVAAKPEPKNKPKPKATKETPKDDKKKSGTCKYYYRGGLCANAQMEKPFCQHEKDISQCPVNKKV